MSDALMQTYAFQVQLGLGMQMFLFMMLREVLSAEAEHLCQLTALCKAGQAYQPKVKAAYTA